MSGKIPAIVMMALAGSFGLVGAGSATAEDGGSPRTCGYYEDAINAVYNHCVPPHGSNIQIEINKTFEGNEFQCVPPEVKLIGGALFTQDAWATGRRC
ncbi:DUF6355 family natural product biosynthesis protein [Allokutzneria sp. A3M-2-11 16]|uniref:DUF6355 family natural product biosynthesis protein n=1 Tax=Allokutzneria sp. A3M-2-11 16 TaxID=2962043 RepID=UPI0020B66CDB|nr:DUF6355 family natural product biosynthesis protein [Allokutzneria sp. A3M-2-11 16]MCP3804343.1 DUF6355 family natural product biosynthesis protein [Allokutzneria sp. A3M-2-11 16]